MDCRCGPAILPDFLRVSASTLDGRPSAGYDLAAGAEHEVPHAMAELQAARFEFGLRPVVGPRRKTFRGVLQQRFRGEHFQNLLRVFLPVGRDVQIAAGLQPDASRCTNGGCISRRLWWRFFGQGSGKKTWTPARLRSARSCA